MPKMTAQLIANITATEDTTGAIPINRSTGNPAFDDSAVTLTEYLILAAGATSLPLPAAVTTQIYIKNLDSAHSIVLGWTPNGGAPVIGAFTLVPGDQFIYWGIPGGINNGFTAITLTPSAATTLVEYFLGG